MIKPKRPSSSRKIINIEKNWNMIKRDLGKDNLIDPLKMILPSTGIHQFKTRLGLPDG